jgi:uncharacterized repeat protein (TIGR03833 family)
MNGNIRADIKAGMPVKIVQKQDQRTGRLTEGIVRDVLTKSALHPHGIKVRLQSGIIGRVKEILDSRASPGAPSSSKPAGMSGTIGE